MTAVSHEHRRALKVSYNSKETQFHAKAPALKASTSIYLKGQRTGHGSGTLWTRIPLLSVILAFIAPRR